MSSLKLIVEKVGDVAVFKLNEPNTLNAISRVVVNELAEAIAASVADARAILLTSVGRAFSSGVSLGEELLPKESDPGDAGLMLETHVNPLILTMKRLPIPLIVAVRGPVVGVGCSIALAGDIIIASDDAYFLLAFTRFGLIPDGGVSWLLTRTLGRARAMELMMLGDRLPASVALEWGLINRIVPNDLLDEVALELAVRVASGPTRAFKLIRDLSWIASERTLEDTLGAERLAQQEAGASRDAAEGIAAFLEKRPSNFCGS